VDPSLADLVLEHLPVALAVVDAEDRVRFANAAGRIAFGDPPVGTALTGVLVELDVRRLPGSDVRLVCLLEGDATRLAELLNAAGESSSLAHDVQNSSTAISLALRAVARALQEDEKAVLADMHARLSTIEGRIRHALSGR
jgi:hypothetical protein